MSPVFAILEGIGGPELLFIAILALLMFGSKRLPELGRAFGRAMREFKRATSGVEENLREVLREEPTPRIRPPAYRGVARPVSGSSSPSGEAKPAPSEAEEPAGGQEVERPEMQPSADKPAPSADEETTR